jgi:TorA maturation chaperone TorD
MKKIEDRLNLVEGKSTLFSLLAQALNYPDRDLEEKVSSGALGQALAETLRPFCQNGLLQKLETLKDLGPGALPEDREERLHCLERDYTWMCFASKPRLVHLFESVYREGKLLQESTFEIARLYHEAGLRMEEGFQLPPDHIAVELECMAYLLYQEAEALRHGDGDREQYARQLQDSLIEKHLRLFGMSFSERMEKHAKTDFYRVIARVLMETLRSG